MAFGFHYFKASPTQYVIQFRGGRIRRQGPGLAFFYFRPAATIALVPVSSVDVPFIYNEVTKDYQDITVQGQLTYRITDPQLAASLLDYTVDPELKLHTSEDPQKLAQRLVNLAQVHTRSAVHSLETRAAIHASDRISAAVMEKLSGSEALAALGVEVLTFAILAIRPTPDISRALEADAREALLRQADDAIYERRNSAVEQERRIKENELSTEIAIENETRQLLDARTQNIRTEADAQAYAIEASLKPLQKLPAAVLDLLAMQSAEPRLLVANALREIAGNAEKIGQLNITPDLLETLIANRVAAHRSPPTESE
jgi:regulator of protease activity HflC (stomatin/prohibitin superfamily)